MKLHLTARERSLLIGGALVLTLVLFLLALIMPLRASIAEQRGQLAVDKANLNLALEAETNAIEVDRRIGELTEVLQSIEMPIGDHQAALLRQLDEVQRRAGVLINDVTFDSPGRAVVAGQTGQAAAAATDRVGLTIKVVGTPAACIEFVAGVEKLSDVVVVDSSVTTDLDTVGVITGYLVHAPR